MPSPAKPQVGQFAMPPSTIGQCPIMPPSTSGMLMMLQGIQVRALAPGKYSEQGEAPRWRYIEVVYLSCGYGT